MIFLSHRLFVKWTHDCKNNNNEHIKGLKMFNTCLDIL